MRIEEPEGLGGKRNIAPYLWLAAAIVFFAIMVVSALGIGQPKREFGFNDDDRRRLPPPYLQALAPIDRSDTLKSVQGTEPKNLESTCESYPLAYDVPRVVVNLSWQPTPSGAARLKLVLYQGDCAGTVLRQTSGSSVQSIDLIDGKLLNAQVSTQVLPEGPGIVAEQPYTLTLTPWRIVIPSTTTPPPK